MEHTLNNISENTDICGEVDKITFRNSENGYTIFRFSMDRPKSLISVTGVFPVLEEGEYLRLQGYFCNHRKYGRQFKATSILPHVTLTGIKRYLSSKLIKGIGKKTADKIITHFGVNTLEILDNNPEKLVEVPTIGKKKALTIQKSWEESQKNRKIDLFLVGHGMSPGMAAKIYSKYGRDTIQKVSENPYRLTDDIRGIGFLTADKIAHDLGLPLDSKERMMACICYIFHESEDKGHCYLTTPQILEEVGRYLKIDMNQMESKFFECMAALSIRNKIVSEKPVENDPDSSNIHFMYDLYWIEKNLAKKLDTMLKIPLYTDKERIDSWLERYNERLPAPLSKAQVAAVKKAVTNRVFILTGGPGVGKTTTANTIIRLLKAMGKTVALAAPTGRAAQRLMELSSETAKTIHRLLEWNPEKSCFNKDSHNQLNADAVIIDESSMLDIRLAGSLIDALMKRSQIIFIGDVDQLPSVGPGNVLRDMIFSNKIPYTKLNEIFRQASSSRIIRAAHDINNGLFPEFSDESGSDFRFIEAESQEEIKEIIENLVSKILPEKCNFNPIHDIQVLTPMNNGELGTNLMNEELQNLINPSVEGIHEFNRDSISFRKGDKVIQNSNNYNLNVFNGDIGIVMETGISGGKISVSFSDKFVTYSFDEVNDLKLAYSITIHKSQGSEFPVVIIPLSTSHYIMLQRNLIYTGLTRAKKLAIFVGSKKALGVAIKNQTSLKRQTKLIERLETAERD
ncbi:MAG: ATP-dependent RecD-like DNA helicase [Oligoflexales bacterium]|nr:ATP-dependent RecD-like DNA helicase [Oligoflexales bacterium]